MFKQGFLLTTCVHTKVDAVQVQEERIYASVMCSGSTFLLYFILYVIQYTSLMKIISLVKISSVLRSTLQIPHGCVRK